MKIAHVGPPRARTGGPAGYLWELAQVAVLDERFTVSFPDEAPPQRPTPPPSWIQRGRASLGKLKRCVFGAPTFRRHALEDLREPGGAAAELLAAAETLSHAEVAPSLEAALVNADVLFAHDAWTADRLLARRRPGQDVWLFLHAPFPLGFFQVWSFGRPDLPWQTIAELTDVRAATERELATFRAVDRLILPCAEAGDEFLRFDSRFAEPLARAEFLPTGAAGPNRRFPAEDRVRLRRRFGLPEAAPIALFLGNDQPYRGLDTLLDALPALAPGPGLVAVAGPAPDRLPTHPRLRALGRVTAVADLLAAVDFVINVNRFSLFDLSTIEALAAGSPLLLHATGGNRAFGRLGAGCRMFPDLAPETIARALDGLFRLDEFERQRLADASRACWVEHLSPAVWWRRHAELYRQEVVPG
ncbi:MAG: glycosyltransferase family 4 protein [Thermoanaerobaculia bacterium]|nr:glycosyltransferase family 4 protein [Thermoanaerobaculia bacterium]